MELRFPRRLVQWLCQHVYANSAVCSNVLWVFSSVLMEEEAELQSWGSLGDKEPLLVILNRQTRVFWIQYFPIVSSSSRKKWEDYIQDNENIRFYKKQFLFPPLLILEAKKTNLSLLIVFLLCGFWKLKTFKNHNFSTTIYSSLVPLAKCSFLYKMYESKISL